MEEGGKSREEIGEGPGTSNEGVRGAHVTLVGTSGRAASAYSSVIGKKSVVPRYVNT